jgi:hypothetical protein
MLCSCEVSRDSLITSRETMIPATPTGTLMKKIQFQLMLSTIRPPTSGPIASAIAETPAQMPIARPRSRGANVAVMIERVAGFISAAPTPWTARAPIRNPAFGASPHARDESVKIAIPTMKIRRRPNMSASFPPVMRRAANVSAYAVTIHSSSEIPTWRSRSIEGSATFTTVLSSMIMNRPNDTAASVHHLRFSGAKILAFIQFSLVSVSAY